MARQEERINKYIRSFYVDSVVDDINSILIEKGFGDNFDSLRDVCDESYSQCLNFTSRDGRTFERLNFNAVRTLTYELVEDLSLERNEIYRAFLSPFYTVCELTDDEIALIMFLSSRERKSISIDDLKRATSMGDLEISALDTALSSLLSSGVIRKKDNEIYVQYMKEITDVAVNC